MTLVDCLLFRFLSVTNLSALPAAPGEATGSGSRFPTPAQPLPDSLSVSSLSRRQDFCVGLSLCFVPAKCQDLGKPLRLSGPRFRTHELGLADFSTVHSYRTHGSFIKDARGETEAMSPVLSCPSESFFLGTIPSLFWSQALCHIFLALSCL